MWSPKKQVSPSNQPSSCHDSVEMRRQRGSLGADFADGGRGDDSIDLRDGLSDSAWCSRGFDSVQAEPLDALGA